MNRILLFLIGTAAKMHSPLALPAITPLQAIHKSKTFGWNCPVRYPSGFE